MEYLQSLQPTKKYKKKLICLHFFLYHQWDQINHRHPVAYQVNRCSCILRPQVFVFWINSIYRIPFCHCHRPFFTIAHGLPLPHTANLLYFQTLRRSPTTLFSLWDTEQWVCLIFYSYALCSTFIGHLMAIVVSYYGCQVYSQRVSQKPYLRCFQVLYNIISILLSLYVLLSMISH